MRGNETPVLEQKWWSKNKPKTLKSTGFGKVLAAYEKVARNTSDVKLLAAQMKALDDIPPAAIKAAKMCNPKKHAETIKVLGKYATVVEKQKKAIGAILDDLHEKHIGFLDAIAAAERDVLPALKSVKANQEIVSKGIKAAYNGLITKPQQLAPLTKLLGKAAKELPKHQKMCKEHQQKLKKTGMELIRESKLFFNQNQKQYAEIVQKVDELKKALSLHATDVKLLKDSLAQVTVS